MYGRGVLVRKYQTDQEIKVGYIGLGCILKIVSYQIFNMISHISKNSTFSDTDRAYSEPHGLF